MQRAIIRSLGLCGALCAAGIAAAQSAPSPSPHVPLRLFGDTYYVGTSDLASILITSPAGDVLIDGDLPESAAAIEQHVEQLGVHLRDVKVILNSHAHSDHAGGIAELQRATGATVEALPWSAHVIETGTPALDDPQYGVLKSYPPASHVRVIHDGDTVRVGPLALVAHQTAGHTPSGTTWTWRSCDGDRCVDVVYADSQTPVSADDFLYTKSTRYSTGVSDFEHGFGVIEQLPCDLLLTPHPGASSLWERVARRDAGDANALIDRDACRRFVKNAREALAKRLETERAR
ncbi:MAG TPA: subclass B3 metallo-beta-lactamase [Gemmatimonadaceae bacterium]|nr:subclass B3 metallo-beta-lactamase [Gemmatimonadaceae bacterium]